VCKQGLGSFVDIFSGDINHRGEANVKTRNEKLDGIKNGEFIDKYGCIDLLNAITDAEI
jgi:hypothetical protein